MTSSNLRLLVIADIHANLPAYNAIRDKVAESFLSIDHVICLGDIVGFGPWPNELTKIAESFSISVIGDMDLTACLSNPIGQRVPFNHIEWTSNNLSVYSKTFLSTLAKNEYLEISENGHNFFFVHGSPEDYLLEGIYPNESKERKNQLLRMIGENDYLVTGHTHIPLYYKNRKRKAIINPGSVGQPCDNDPRASAVVLEVKKDTEIKINWIRTAYDVDQVIERMEEVGIPQHYGQRLRKGVTMNSANLERIFFGN